MQKIANDPSLTGIDKRAQMDEVGREIAARATAGVEAINEIRNALSGRAPGPAAPTSAAEPSTRVAATDHQVRAVNSAWPGMPHNGASTLAAFGVRASRAGRCYQRPG